MRRILGILLLLWALALTWLVAGCRPGAEQTTTSPPGGGAPAVAGAALGTEQAAGPFQVTLSTDPAAPKVGETRFQAKVSRSGQPVSGATVRVSLSMPSMNMAGPEVTLKPAGAGEYEGTANLGMAGDWQAKTTVSAGADTGAAIYQLTAGQ
jgi:nitrogen fixation protein FixH